MCGICGVVQLRGEPGPVIAPEGLDRMTDVMTHRGPNDRGTYLADGIALGVRRLSIVDVEGGHQPFANEDRRDLGRPERRALQPRRDPRTSSSGRGHSVREPLRHRDPPAPLRGRGSRVPGAAPRHVRPRGLGSGASGARCSRATGSGSSRSTTPRSAISLVFGSELKSLLASGLVPHRSRLRGDRRLPDARLRSRPADAARGRQEADAGPRPGDRARPACEEQALLDAIRSPTPAEMSLERVRASACSQASRSRCACG